MTPSDVQTLLTDDRWALAEANTPIGPGLLRYRQPVLRPTQTAGYPRCLRFLWGYAQEGSGALPDESTSSALAVFENRLVPALESDGLAVLVAVFTFDGARQWVFYTADVQACGARLQAIPQEAEPYPIEIDAFPDPEWRYLREQLLARVPREA